MRSLQEIDADIAAVQARMAERQKSVEEGMPQKDSPEYRAARFDYIVEGNRSGLDNYQNALNAAVQNKLTRESTAKALKEGKEQTDEEAMEQWVKDYTFAKNAKAEIDNNPSASERQKADADALVRHYETVGNRKGYLKKYNDAAAPAVAPAAAPAAEPSEPKETFKGLIAKGKTLAEDKDLDEYIAAVKGYTGNDAVVGEAYDAIAEAQAKKKANADKRWSTFKDEVEAAIKDKNIGKLKELKGRIGDFDATDKATVEQKMDAAMKPKAASPVVKYIKNLKPINLMSDYTKLRRAKDKTKTDNAPIGGQSYPYKIVYNNDGSLTVSGGGYSRTFNSSDFSEESLDTRKKPESVNNVERVLSNGGSGRKVMRGLASRKAPVPEPED